jgi:hypothetical protein
MNGFITPKLEYFECPTPTQVLCTEQLVSLLPRFIHFSAGVDAKVIEDMLIDAGCVQVESSGDRVVFTGRALPARAAWRKCLEITGPTRQLVFDIIPSSASPSAPSLPPHLSSLPEIDETPAG